MKHDGFSLIRTPRETLREAERWLHTEEVVLASVKTERLKRVYNERVASWRAEVERLRSAIHKLEASK
jgi:hypothetical protein